MRGHAERGRPILLLGVSRRSGTNYVASVLLCHRQTAAPAAPVAEDHLLAGITSLERYVRRTAARWPRRWGDRAGAADDLRRALGGGLLTFLDERSDGLRTVSRTPSTVNLDRAARWYPGADVVVLVRDGRSVAASLATAWGWPLELAILEWRRGARRILQLRARTTVRTAEPTEPTVPPDPHQPPETAVPPDPTVPTEPTGPTDAALSRDTTSGATRFLVLRYEDVLADLDGTVSRLLRFTGLDPAGFDHERARHLPVLGSSYVRDDEGRVTWEPRAATADFDPTRRFADWSSAEQDRFAWLAGDEQRALGYAVDEVATTGPGRAARMIALDATLPIRLAPWRARRSLANALRTARAEWRARRVAQSAGADPGAEPGDDRRAAPGHGGGATSSSTTASTASSRASTR